MRRLTFILNNSASELDPRGDLLALGKIMLGAIRQRMAFNGGEALILIHVRPLVDGHGKGAFSEQSLRARIAVIQLYLFKPRLIIAGIAAKMSLCITIGDQ